MRWPRTLGVLGSVARKYAHRIPFLVKFNHNEFLTYPEQVRPDRLREHEAGAGHGVRRGGCHDLLRLGRIGPADRGGEPGVRHGARAGHGHRALVLPAQQRLQEGQGLSRLGRPDRPGQSPRRDDPGRHHQAEAAGEQRRLQRAQHARRIRTARPTSASTPSSPPIIRSTSAATRSPTATWVARGSSTPVARRAPTTSPRRRRTAVINKRAGGIGLISGRKAFQRPMAEGVKLLNLIQDVYLAKEITVA